MSTVSTELPASSHFWFRDKILLGMTPGRYFRSLLTPGNAVVLVILLVGLPVTFIRYSQGLAGSTNLSQTNPWGLWIAIDVMCGVALAAGGFVTGAAVHLFGMKEYKPLVRPAVLTGFLGYVLVAVGLLYDLGRPWRLPYPLVVSLGMSSVMFEVAFCVATYLLCQFVELWPPIFHWLGFERLRKWSLRLVTGATVMAVVLSTLHQSSLGALLLIAPGKLHPLWYSMYMPVFFLISAIAGGIGMVSVESSLSHNYFIRQVGEENRAHLDKLIVGLGKAGALVMFMYFWMRWIGVAHDHSWGWLATGYGLWWLVEVFGFIALPCFLFAVGHKARKVSVVRVAAVLSILGVILNRVNVTIIAFNWNSPDKYYPHWMEYVVTITIITVGVMLFKWFVNRMPILLDRPPTPSQVRHG